MELETSNPVTAEERSELCMELEQLILKHIDKAGFRKPSHRKEAGEIMSEPAFPGQATRCDVEPNPGMSLRDYFAAKAMIYVLEGCFSDYDDVANRSYKIADAMLRARDV